MKIGLISINMYAKGLNFACPLHTFAFQQFLKQNGIDSTVIDYKPNYYGNFDMRHPADAYQLAYEGLLETKKDREHHNLPVDQTILEITRIRDLRDDYQTLYEEREQRFDKFQKFIDSTYIKTEESYDANILEYKDPGFDCYICVTDVIWGLKKTTGFDMGFFLNCAAMNDKYKISYAASRGVFQGYTPQEKKSFLRMVKRIDQVSVRENALRDWIHENSDIEATTVVDPVLLHDKDFWDTVAVEPEEKDYILLYYVMEKSTDTIDNAIQYAKEHNLDIIELSDKPFNQEIEGIRHIPKYAVGPDEWLGYIKNAKCIFTNSFHACCFSIIFEKTFYVGKRKGDKVGQVLDVCGLTDRVVTSEHTIKDISETIDYVAVKERLQMKREESKAFILGAIKKAEKSRIKNKIKSGTKKVIKTMMRNGTGYRKLTYPIRYSSGNALETLSWNWEENAGVVNVLSKNEAYFTPKQKLVNYQDNYLLKNQFFVSKYEFTGWRICVNIGKLQIWYTKDKTFATKEELGEDWENQVMVFKPGDMIPKFPFNRASVVIAEAVWNVSAFTKVERKENCKYAETEWNEKMKALNQYNPAEDVNTDFEYEIFYHSGKDIEKQFGELSANYDVNAGKLNKYASGTQEYHFGKVLRNNEVNHFEKNAFVRSKGKFVGWKMRVRIGESWCWYLEDGSLGMRVDYGPEFESMIKVFEDGEQVPHLLLGFLDSAVVEAVWEKEVK
ncbi:MAG: polysaccharide pyruvyl transferase family protein [Eubacteriales bacterium]|nr:polysaccharide pyruvyl transferase family protein [Eubacteriales bacterium]